MEVLEYKLQGNGKHSWKVKLDNGNIEMVYENPFPNLPINASPLDIKKRQACDAIDKRTQEIIGTGFIFEGKTFSNSESAQGNWTKIALAVACGAATGADFPVLLSCLDNTSYSLVFNKVNDFYRVHLLSINSAKTSGSILKQQIMDAINEAAVKLVVDNR